MLTVQLQGGLGNQLFQLAALDTISKQTNRVAYLERLVSEKTHHSSKNYFDSIFLEWKRVPCINPSVESVQEPSFQYREWVLPPSQSVRLCGYFQDYRYVSESFLQSLWLPNVPVLTGAFLHIRGGDYVGNPFHHINLNDYYARAVELFSPETKFYIFTNDVAYAKTLSFLNTISHTFIDEQDETTCLALMKYCSLGGICANSSFSWWGAFLNRNRTLVLPSKWYPDSSMYTEGYYFPGAITCPV